MSGFRVAGGVVGESEWQLPVVLARMPEVFTSLLAIHVVGADGRCRGCRSQVGPGERWPCTLYRAAARARRIAAGQRLTPRRHPGA